SSATKILPGATPRPDGAKARFRHGLAVALRTTQTRVSPALVVCAAATGEFSPAASIGPEPKLTAPTGLKSAVGYAVSVRSSAARMLSPASTTARGCSGSVIERSGLSDPGLSPTSCPLGCVRYSDPPARARSARSDAGMAVGAGGGGGGDAGTGGLEFPLPPPVRTSAAAIATAARPPKPRTPPPTPLRPAPPLAA